MENQKKYYHNGLYFDTVQEATNYFNDKCKSCFNILDDHRYMNCSKCREENRIKQKNKNKIVICKRCNKEVLYNARKTHLKKCN